MGFFDKIDTEEKYSTKEEALEAVRKDGFNLEFVSKELKNDKDIVLEAIKDEYGGESIIYASDELKKNREFMLEIAKNYNIDEEAFEKDKLLKKWLDDEDFVLTAIKSSRMSINGASDRLYSDKKFILKLLANNCSYDYYACYISEDYWNDFVFTYIWAKKTGKHEPLYNVCLSNGINPVKYGGVDTIDDIHILRKLCKILENSDVEGLSVISNEHFALELVEENVNNFKFVSNEILTYDLVMKVVKQKGTLLSYATEEFQNNYDIVMTAVKQNGMALKYASEELQDNANIVMTAVKQNGIALQYASAIVRGMYDVVLEAVKQNGIALQYASEIVQGMYDVVLEAVKQNGSAWIYASNGLATNPDILLAAAHQNALGSFSRGFINYDLIKIQSEIDILDNISNIDVNKNSTYEDMLKALELGEINESHLKGKLEKLLRNINCINDKVNNSSYYNSFERDFFMLDYNHIPNAIYSMLNEDYKIGDNYSDYDEIDSIEEKRRYDEEFKALNKEIIKEINDKYILLQNSISKKYAEKFSNDENKCSAYNEVILLHYLTHAIEKYGLHKIDCFEILEYIIRNKISIIEPEDLSKHLQFLKENKDSRYVKSYVDSLLDKLSDLDEDTLQCLFSLLEDANDKFEIDSVISKHYLPF